ncbi:MAG: rubrerythrin family protein [Kiritimatiellia bacterium]
MSSIDNLKAAFAGESQANRRYLAFAQKADAEGFKQVAKLFRAAAEAETVHAHAHFRALGGVKDTAANLAEAAEGERYEFQEMYPPFLAEAQKEGHKAAAASFKNALAVEEIHNTLYKQAFAAVKQGSDLSATAIYVCSVCGNTVTGSAPDKCSVCNVDKAKFVEIK